MYTGKTPLTRHHLTIIPANVLMSAAMNDTDTTEGGYYNSKMKQETLNPNFTDSVYQTYIAPAFENHIFTYYTLLSREVDKERINNGHGGSTGASSSWMWSESKCDLMSEANVYGSDKFSSSGYDTGIDNRQYAIFQLKPELINSDGAGGRFGVWLKNVSDATTFTIASGTGNSSFFDASRVAGVRPRFLIG